MFVSIQMSLLVVPSLQCTFPGWGEGEWVLFRLTEKRALLLGRMALSAQANHKDEAIRQWSCPPVLPGTTQQSVSRMLESGSRGCPYRPFFPRYRIWGAGADGQGCISWQNTKSKGSEKDIPTITQWRGCTWIISIPFFPSLLQIVHGLLGSRQTLLFIKIWFTKVFP